MKIAEQKPWTGCVYWHSLRSCPLPNIPLKKEKKNRQITGELNKPGGEQKIYIIRLSDPQCSLRSRPLPIIPLCLSKKKNPDRRLPSALINWLLNDCLGERQWIFWPFLNKRLVPRIKVSDWFIICILTWRWSELQQTNHNRDTLRAF